MNTDDVIKWIRFGQAVFAEGKEAWDAIKAAAAAHGVDADNAQLDQVALEAGQRKAIAQREADGGQTA